MGEMKEKAKCSAENFSRLYHEQNQNSYILKTKKSFQIDSFGAISDEEWKHSYVAPALHDFHLAIIGLRNQVIHSYDSISDENIWSVLINHLPKLKIEIENLISSEWKD